ncbi:hypothetical protein BH20ACI4_BH20ACI4_03540 [soil metagenome]
MRLYFPLSGDDVFISYSRKDGALYAAGLADKLTEKNLSCFIDKLGTEPNHDLPPSLKKKIKNCTIFVLIGTEKAAQSEFVGKEIAEFRGSGRTILPINFGNNLGDAAWYEQIPGLAIETEKDSEALETGNPSQNVVNFIEKSFNYTRRNQYMFRMFWGALSLFLILIGLGIGSYLFAINKANSALQEADKQSKRAEDLTRKADQAEQRATEQEKIAKDKEAEARKQTEIAKVEKNKADKAGKLADEKNKLALEKTKIADEQTKLADEETKRAESANEEAKKQTEQAKKQLGIAQALELANESTRKLEEGPISIREALSIAVKSVKKADENKTQLVESETALRKAIALIPSVSFDKKEILGRNKTITISPDGKYIVALRDNDQLQIYNTEAFKLDKENKPLKIENIDKEVKYIATNNNAEKIVAASLSKIQIYDKETGKKIIIESKELSTDETDNVNGIAISPDGKYLAVIVGGGNGSVDSGEGSEGAISKALFWDIQNNQRLAVIIDNLDIELKSANFSAEGNILAIGGGSFGGTTNIGYSVLWNLNAIISQVEWKKESEETNQNSKVEQNSVCNPDVWKAAFDKHRVVLPQDDFVEFIVPGKNIDQFAVATRLDKFGISTEGVNSKIAITVWRKPADGVFKPEIYLTRPQLVSNILFINDFKNLAIIRANIYSEQEDINVFDESSWKRFYEEWESTGYDAVSEIRTEYGIDSVLFNENNNLLRLALGNNVTTADVLNNKEISAVQDDETNSQEKVLRVLGQGKYILVEKNKEFFIKNTQTEKVARLQYKLKKEDLLDEILISDNGQILAFKGYHEAKIVNVESGKEITPEFVKAENIVKLSLSANGRYVAFSSPIEDSGDTTTNFKEILIVVEINSNKIISQTTTKVSKFNSFNFSKDEKYLATADDSGETQILSLEKENTLAMRLTHLLPVQNVVFSHNGKSIATTSYAITGDVPSGNGSEVSIFDVKTGKLTTKIHSERFITSISFSYDGNYLAAASKSYSDFKPYSIMIWSLNLNDLILIAQSRLD